MKLLYPLIDLSLLIAEEARMYQRLVLLVGSCERRRHQNFVLVQHNFLSALRLERFLLEGFGVDGVDDLHLVLLFVQVVDLELGDVVN